MDACAGPVQIGLKILVIFRVRLVPRNLSRRLSRLPAPCSRFLFHRRYTRASTQQLLFNSDPVVNNKNRIVMRPLPRSSAKQLQLLESAFEN
jgi:hypothetical protein